MKFFDPDWIGEVIRCDNCIVKFTLEIEDEGLVTFTEEVYNSDRAKEYQYEMACPKCQEKIVFYVDAFKSNQKIPSQKNEIPEAIEAYLLEAPKYPEDQPIDVESELIDEEMDVRAMRRRLLNNND